MDLNSVPLTPKKGKVEERIMYRANQKKRILAVEGTYRKATDMEETPGSSLLGKPHLPVILLGSTKESITFPSKWQWAACPVGIPDWSLQIPLQQLLPLQAINFGHHRDLSSKTLWKSSYQNQNSPRDTWQTISSGMYD